MLMLCFASFPKKVRPLQRVCTRRILFIIAIGALMSAVGNFAEERFEVETVLKSGFSSEPRGWSSYLST